MTDTEVIWKDIPGYEGHYQASTDGHIRSMTKVVNVRNGYKAVKKGKELTPLNLRKGYYGVRLSKEGHAKTERVHRLVALTFLPNPEGLPCVNHKDENPKNNCVDNLEWCTYAYNNAYGSCREKAARARVNHPRMSRAVLQFSLSGEFIAEYPSLAAVERAHGYDAAHVDACALHKPKARTAYGYIWRFKDDADQHVMGEGQ